ncbi:MAG TPA: universal stress protein [Candidatus Saccharimonadales bacterium]|nr:universal stress protein [Candidatus Saccharimonadales bacterium]
MFRTILIATDGMEAGDAAVAYGRDLALEPEIRAKIREQVSDLQDDGLDADFEIRRVVAKSPAHAIAGAATAVDADLIMLSQVEEGVVRGALGGGVVRRLMQLARCAVLVVPNRRTPSRSARASLRVLDGSLVRMHEVR